MIYELKLPLRVMCILMHVHEKLHVYQVFHCYINQLHNIVTSAKLERDFCNIYQSLENMYNSLNTLAFYTCRCSMYGEGCKAGGCCKELYCNTFTGQCEECILKGRPCNFFSPCCPGTKCKLNKKYDSICL